MTDEHIAELENAYNGTGISMTNDDLDKHHEDGPFEDYTEREVRSAYVILGEMGYKIMHRRNGQFWLMIDRPMTFGEIYDFAWNCLLVMNRMLGKLEFTPEPAANSPKALDAAE